MSLKRKILDYDFAGLLPKKQTVYIFRKNGVRIDDSSFGDQLFANSQLCENIFPVKCPRKLNTPVYNFRISSASKWIK